MDDAKVYERKETDTNMVICYTLSSSTYGRKNNTTEEYRNR